MRLPLLRPVALLLCAALVAAACADEPGIDELLDSRSAADSAPIETADPDALEADPDRPTEIPAATAPDPDPTPLPVDSDYRIGTLPNGLTYMLRSNDVPGGSLDLRLVVDAGSLQQPAGMDGSAHFLEHMLFNGTESFPGNELTTQLQRLGISFGADISAYTSYDETVYFLGATTFDRSSADLAFDVLAEWAGRATLNASDVAAEMGVVRDELRQGRESIDGIIFTRFEDIYTRGTPYEGHRVGGDPSLVESMTTEILRAYYDDWYRPDNMAVVAVGDLPLDELEREVVSRFTDLESRSDARPTRGEVSIGLDPDPVVEVFTHPDAGPDFLSLDIPLPVWDAATVGGERMTLIENAVALMLDRRLGEAFQRGDLEVDQQPFIGTFAINRGLRYYGTNLQADALDVGLEQFMSHLLLAARQGFTDDDVDRVRDIMLAALDDELATLGSTQDFVYADALTAAFLQDGAIDDAENRIRRQRAVIERLEPEELSNFWRWIFESSGPILIEVGENAAALPTADRLRAVLEAAQPAGAVSATGSIDELMVPPAPAATTDERSRRAGYDVVQEWTFENGVVVSFQGSTRSEGSFDVWMESTGGWSALDEPDLARAAAAVDAVSASGVGPHDPPTLERYLESRDVSLFATIDELQEAIYATAATSDAEDLFALIHLTMTEPRVDDVALRSVARGAATTLERAENDANLRVAETLTRLASADDPRYDILLDADDIEALDGPELRSIFVDRFGAVDDLHVAIIGDIDETTVFELASRYLGTLPVGPGDSWEDLGVRSPTTAQSAEVALTEGTANGGLVRFDWLEGDILAADEIVAVLLSTIITNRITTDIREELGASYGGAASISSARVGVSNLSSFIEIDGDPARLDEIRNALDGILADMATGGPTDDEFDQAFRVVENDFNFVNDALYLTTNLALSRFPGQDILRPEDRVAILDTITPTDVRAMAAELYGDPVFIEVVKVFS